MNLIVSSIAGDVSEQNSIVNKCVFPFWEILWMDIKGIVLTNAATIALNTVNRGR